MIGMWTTIAMVALIAVASSANQLPSHAQSDEVCGNATVDSGEQCDDGNLTPGDGCSAYCLNEVCGNGHVDSGEQCDDGNGMGGDGCGSLCTIEFCGDGLTQSPETCDDANNISGDGCSAMCQTESDSQLDANLVPIDTTASSVSGDQAQPETNADPQAQTLAPPPLPVIPPRVLQTAVEAAESNTFIRSEEGDSYIQYLEVENQESLKDILRALRDRKALTSEQREQAEQLSGDLGLAKFAERDKYNDMLARLIATTISESVVSEQALDQAKLTGDPTLIVEELQKAVTPMKPTQIRSETANLLSELQRQGVEIEGLSAESVAAMIGDDRSPIEVFQAVVEAKEKVEKVATKDVDQSYASVLAHVRMLRTSLPVLEQQFGMNREKLEARLSELESVAATATPAEAREVVDAINKLTITMERSKKVDKRTLDSIDEAAANRALQRFAENVRSSPMTASLIGDTTPEQAKPGDLLKLTDAMSRQAPLMQRKAFASKDVEAQKSALIQYIFSQPDIMRMRAILQEGDHVELDERETQLRKTIERIGKVDLPDDSCDDSVADALPCVEAHFTWMQQQVRDRNWLSRIGGFFEDAGAVDMFHEQFSSPQ